ncbi:hypothetical protein PM082_021427 [Marasmius tenuissimus]|nr:hypothetical protein PM082_021427 [Marasmius tenuissimus]
MTLQLEVHPQSLVKRKRLIDVRILGYLLREGPTDQAINRVAQGVVECERRTENIVMLGRYYDKWFLRPFRNAEVLSQLSSPPQWFESDYPSLKEHGEARAKSLSHPKDAHEAREAALIRDNWRCVLSNVVEWDACRHDPEVFSASGEENQLISFTTVHHIIPVCAQPQTFAVLESFGYPGLTDELSGERIHSLKNLLTINKSFHNQFDDQSIWVEPMEDTPNSYKRAIQDRTGILALLLKPWKVPETICFTTCRPELDLPCPRLLTLRAASCKVAQWSGLCDYLKTVDNMVLDSNTEAPSPDLLAAKLMDIAECVPTVSPE